MRNQLKDTPTAPGEAGSEDIDSGSLGAIDPDATQPIDVCSLILNDGESS